MLRLRGTVTMCLIIISKIVTACCSGPQGIYMTAIMYHGHTSITCTFMTYLLLNLRIIIRKE